MECTRQQFLARTGRLGGGLIASSAIGGLLLSACGGEESNQASAGGGKSFGTVKTQLSWIKNVEFAGWWIALENGYFDDEGVTAEFLAGGPSAPKGEATVIGGSSDLGLDTSLIPFMSAIGSGADLVMFAAQFQINPSGLLSLADNPVNVPEDLVGKRIGVQENSGGERIIDGIFKVNKLPLEREYVPVGFDPSPLLEGACDVYTCYVTNQPLILEDKNIDYVVKTNDEFNQPNYANFVFGKRSYVEENHDALVGWLRATIKGWQDNRADAALGAEVSVAQGKALGLKLDQQTRENEAQIPLMENELTRDKGLFWISKEALEGPMYKALRAAGYNNLPDVDSIVDLSILEDAYGGQTRI